MNKKVKVVIVMLKEVEIFICLVFLLLSVLLIFNARLFVRNKMDKSNENIKVIIIKWFGAIIAVLSLIILYYLN